MTAMADSRAVGPLTVIALDDADGPFFGRARRRVPGRHRRRTGRPRTPSTRPRATADGGWWLRFRSFAIRYADGPVTLVDAGIGPADAPAADWAPVPGRLPDELAAAGHRAGATSTAIVLTHLHNDHIGWAVPARPRRSPKRAVIVPAGRRRRRSPTGRGQDDLLRPLRRAGGCRWSTATPTLGPGVRVGGHPGAHARAPVGAGLGAATRRLLVDRGPAGARGPAGRSGAGLRARHGPGAGPAHAGRALGGGPAASWRCRTWGAVPRRA